MIDVLKNILGGGGGGGSSRSFEVAHFPQIGQDSTEYVSINSERAGVGSSGSDPTDEATLAEDFCWIPTFAGQLKYAYGRVNAAPAAGQTFTLTVMKNGVATDLVVTFTDAGITANNTADSVSFVAGDRLAWQVTNSATSGNFKGSVGIGVEIPAGEAGTSVYNEIPAGDIDGVNDTFTLAATPLSGSERIYRNGLRQTPGVSGDYQISGATITFNAGKLPQTGDELAADYNT